MRLSPFAEGPRPWRVREPPSSIELELQLERRIERRCASPRSWRVPVRGAYGNPPGRSSDLPRPGLVRPLPLRARSGTDLAFIRARRRSSPPITEPSHGGDQGAPPRTALHDRFTWFEAETSDPRSLFPRDGTVPASFHDTIRLSRELDGDTGTNGGRTNTASSLRGRSLGRRIACATPPGRSRFRKVLTPGPSVHLPPGRSGGVTTEPPAGWGGAVRPFTVHARDKSLLFRR